MISNHRIRLACVGAAVIVAACSDDRVPTAPTVIDATAAPSMEAAKARGRVPSIASLALGSTYVDIGTGSTPFTVTVTNATDKDFQGVFVKGEIRQGNTTVPATAFIAYCPYPTSTVPPGNCTMTGSIYGVSPNLELGPATYTLKLVQKQSNDNMKMLDSKTVDVILRKTVVVE